MTTFSFDGAKKIKKCQKDKFKNELKGLIAHLFCKELTKKVR